MGFFNPVIPTQNFVQSRNTILLSHLTGILSIPNLAPILLYNPEYRASNKGYPGCRETLFGTLLYQWSRRYVGRLQRRLD